MNKFFNNLSKTEQWSLKESLSAKHNQSLFKHTLTIIFLKAMIKKYKKQKCVWLIKQKREGNIPPSISLTTIQLPY